LQGVYNGVLPGLMASAPACAAFFGAYDYFKRRLAETVSAHHPHTKL
jgi:hypothetical protein